MEAALRSTVLSGWGLTSPSRANLGSATADRLPALLSGFGHRGVIARGLGRSYGDPALNAGGAVLTLESSLLDVELDETAGTVRAGGGVSLHDLLEIVLPRGFFVPVTPGTRYVTVGGAIASDIHGKNHHLEGSFGNHVLDIELLTADGNVRSIDPSADPDLFWATIGGMGLTGIITAARFRLLRVETSRCLVSTHRFDNIDDLMSAMTEDDEQFRYSVAWTDLQSTGRTLGRSVLWRGDHARLSDLDAADRSDPFLYEPQHLVTVPPLVPSPGFVNAWTSRIFCEAWFRRAPRRRDAEIKSIPAYFHPLDAIGRWNRLYGRQGFLQYQFVVPFGGSDTVRRIVERISISRMASPLVVLKRFGASNAGHLSFPMPGWTLTVDVPAGHPDLPALLGELDALVLDAGGRHYLAKDAHMTPEAVRRGYPRLGEWQAVQRRVDPGGLWQSDQARRLRLLERNPDMKAGHE